MLAQFEFPPEFVVRRSVLQHCGHVESGVLDKYRTSRSRHTWCRYRPRKNDSRKCPESNCERCKNVDRTRTRTRIKLSQEDIAFGNAFASLRGKLPPDLTDELGIYLDP